MTRSAFPAVAGPPFVTDDPVPTDDRSWEIYTGLQDETLGDGNTSLDAPFVGLNYGALPNVQVSFSSAIGTDGSVFGIKTRFVQEKHGWPQIAFYPSVALPTHPGEHAVKFLPIWMQKSSGPWTVFGGGGVSLDRNPGEHDSTLFGLAIERTLSPTFTVGAELSHQGAAAIGSADVTVANLGMIATLGRSHALLFSAGRGLHGGPTFSGYASYEIMLGPSASK